MSLNATSSTLDGETYGHNLNAYFKLRYTPATFEKFVEPPRLDWHEKICMKEHHKGQWWEFETNMYTHNPSSKTLLVWPSRYVAAYASAGGGAWMNKGSAKLLDKQGMPVGLDKLGRNHAGAAAQADAVRSYLKTKGGILLIEVHDVPAITTTNLDADEHKERLLIFNCGLEGNAGLRVRAEQYLDVDAAKPRAAWKREFKMAWGTTWATRGLSKVAVPPLVGNPRPATFMAGECW
jgi:hypothetical protein